MSRTNVAVIVWNVWARKFDLVACEILDLMDWPDPCGQPWIPFRNVRLSKPKSSCSNSWWTRLMPWVPLDDLKRSGPSVMSLDLYVDCNVNVNVKVTDFLMHASQVRSIGDGILQKGQPWYHPERKSPSFGFWWIGHPQAAWQKWCQSWSSAVFFMHTDSRYLWKLLQTTMVLKIQDEIGLHGKDAALRRLNTMSLKARLGLLNWSTKLWLELLLPQNHATGAWRLPFHSPDCRKAVPYPSLVWRRPVCCEQLDKSYSKPSQVCKKFPNRNSYLDWNPRSWWWDWVQTIGVSRGLLGRWRCHGEYEKLMQHAAANFGSSKEKKMPLHREMLPRCVCACLH